MVLLVMVGIQRVLLQGIDVNTTENLVVQDEKCSARIFKEKVIEFFDSLRAIN